MNKSQNETSVGGPTTTNAKFKQITLTTWLEIAAAAVLAVFVLKFGLLHRTHNHLIFGFE